MDGDINVNSHQDETCSERKTAVIAYNIHTATATLYIAQSVRSLYLRSPRSAAPMQDGAAGAAQIEDNLGVKQDAAVDVGRTETDLRASRRCELPLSRNSSTDEAQLESGNIISVRRDLAVLTPYLRSRRRVTKTLPTATHTRRATETSRFLTRRPLVRARARALRRRPREVRPPQVDPHRGARRHAHGHPGPLPRAEVL